ncbi:hypothetical protein HMPREF9601_00400 [Cutibacterium acnes HL030PA1]|nr:hypothetical protein HMPREF9601_00400 [Cutibacterium acnes HL030PA1]
MWFLLTTMSDAEEPVSLASLSVTCAVLAAFLQSKGPALTCSCAGRRLFADPCGPYLGTGSSCSDPCDRCAHNWRGRCTLFPIEVRHF